MRAFSSFALFCLFCITLAAGSGVVLRHQAKSGETALQRTVITVKRGQEKTEVDAVVESKVEKVASGEYTVRTRSKSAFLRTSSGEVSDTRTNERRTRYSADGTLQAIESGTSDVASYRLALITHFVAPPKEVEVGATWTSTRKADQPSGMPGTEIAYSLDSVKDGVAYVSFSLKEATGDSRESVTGKWAVRVKDGVPLKMEADATNFLGEAGATATIQLQLLQPKS